MSESMSPYVAVFNQHINNAGKKANRDVIAKFGRKAFNQVFPRAYREGIMAMKGIPETMRDFYVERVTAYVNAHAE